MRRSSGVAAAAFRDDSGEHSKYSKPVSSVRRLRLPRIVQVLLVVAASFASLVTIYQHQLLYNEQLLVLLDADLRLRVDNFLQSTRTVPDLGGARVGLVLLAHDREEYLRDCVKSLLAARRFEEVNLIVSMDEPSHFEKIRKVLSDLKIDESRALFVENQMFLGTWFFHSADDRISNHYRRALETVYDRLGFDFAIFLETDLVVSRDFFDFMFEGGKQLLRESTANHHPLPPSSLFCVSGWSDNGFVEYELRDDRVYRTDFFPGLGWMMHKRVWDQYLGPAWPSRFGTYVYDMWIRFDSPIAYQECLAPEVSRTRHIAKYGTHVNGQKHETYDSMEFANGTVVVSAAEFALVGNVTLFEERIKHEFLNSARTVPLDVFLDNVIPSEDNIVVIVPGGPHDSVSPELMKVHVKLGLFAATFRGGHKGLVSVKLLDYDGTRVTVIRDDFQEFWENEQDPPII